MVLVLAVALTCLVAGTTIAWLLAASDLPGRRWLLVASAIPLAVPSYVGAFGWLDTFPGLRGFWPTWGILSAACVPYVVLPTVAALRAADHSLVDVARSLGRTRWGAFRSGLLPQLAPAALAGALLAGLYALSDFGTPGLMRHEVLTFAVYRQYGSMVGRERAALLALVLVMLALALVGLERLVRGDAARWSVSRGATRPAPPARLGAWTVPALGLALLPVLVAAVVPCLALLRRLSLGTRRPLDLAELGTAVGSTLLVSTLGGLLALALAGAVGVLSARHRGRLVSALETASFAGHALPGIVVGLSLVYLTLRVFPALYQTLAVLVLAYAVLFLPKAVGAVRSSVGAVPPSVAEVATSLGRGRVRAQLVTARLAAPGISAGFLLVVITAMKELPATLMLRPSGFDTLATEIWGRTSTSAQGAAAPYALALVLLASVPAVVLSRSTTWERR
ncbi:ABC transporter permease [Nocardioides solisilvae]|uniref:ABC transporter permease n=1 Tax=Nocardioides solisilvae TaxID=1542435 RepID=UPI00194F1CF6|nr:iron ABC transporter permease [Nocardioides solisilvae]